MSCLRSHPCGRNGKTGTSGDMGPFTTSLMCIYSREGLDGQPVSCPWSTYLCVLQCTGS